VGTVRIQTASATSSSAGCDSGNMKFEVDDPNLSFGSGAFAAGKTYYGFDDAGAAAQHVTPPPPNATRQMPLMLHTAAHGRSVALVGYYFFTQKCEKSSNDLAFGEFGPPPAAVNRKGTFSEHDHFDYPVGGGYVAHVTTTVQGKFSVRRVHGTLRVDGAVASPAGAIVDHCSTGTVRWLAASK
jgi:hypothetical protein